MGFKKGFFFYRLFCRGCALHPKCWCRRLLSYILAIGSISVERKQVPNFEKNRQKVFPFFLVSLSLFLFFVGMRNRGRYWDNALCRVLFYSSSKVSAWALLFFFFCSSLAFSVVNYPCLQSYPIANCQYVYIHLRPDPDLDVFSVCRLLKTQRTSRAIKKSRNCVIFFFKNRDRLLFPQQPLARTSLAMSQHLFFSSLRDIYISFSFFFSLKIFV